MRLSLVAIWMSTASACSALPSPRGDCMLGSGKLVALDNDKDRQIEEENWASLALARLPLRRLRGANSLR